VRIGSVNEGSGSGAASNQSSSDGIDGNRGNSGENIAPNQSLSKALSKLLINNSQIGSTQEFVCQANKTG